MGTQAQTPIEPSHSSPEAPGGSPRPPSSPLAIAPRRQRTLLEHRFERFLWSSRFAVLAAVIASVAIAFGMFYVASVDTVVYLAQINTYARQSQNPEKHEELRTEMVAHVVEAVDGFLLATVMLIFGLGLYELFISRLDHVRRDERSRVLMIHSLDDLKHRLGQLVILILVVKVFEGALAISLKGLLDLVLLAVAIMIIAVALYLSSKQEPAPQRQE